MNIEDRAGLLTAWITRGEGPHPALFLHCALATSRSLLPLMDRLTGIFEMAAPDLPGHGQSADWDGEGDYLGRCVDMAETFCAGPRDLVGHSLGGVVALAMMARRPELVRRAVLIEPVFFAAAEGHEGYGQYLQDQGGIAEALADGDPDLATARFIDIWGAGRPWDAIPPVERHAMAERIKLIEAAAPGLMEDSLGILAPDLLERITVPVLLLRGADSHPVIAEIHAALMARLPDAREHVLPGARHMAAVTDPDAVKAPIHDHIRRRQD